MCASSRWRSSRCLTDRQKWWADVFRAFMAAAVVLMFVLIVVSRSPRWLAAGPTPNCDVRNRYDGKQWNRAKTLVTWAGPCADGRAHGRGILEWFRDGGLTVHYEGEMSSGRMTGLGVVTGPQGIRYDGVWQDGELEHGVARYPDGRRFEGDWYQGGWSKGVLTAPGRRRMEGSWYEGRLDGKGVSEGPEGRYEGDWNKGKPDGLGVFEASNGERYEGEWRDGKPNGQGTGRNARGETFTGVWKRGCVVNTARKDCIFQ
jgi:hypothetical protein